MSITIIEQGYLETPYLEEEYLTGQASGISGMQFNVVIEDAQAIGTQFKTFIEDLPSATGLQFDVFIGTTTAYGVQFQGVIESAVETGLQFSVDIAAFEQPYGTQFEGQIVDQLGVYGTQFNAQIETETQLGTQFNANILDFPNATGLQFNVQIVDSLSPTGLEFRVNNFDHLYKGVYLVDDYLTEPYLVEQMCAIGGVQFNVQIAEESPLGLQFEGKIDTETQYGLQFEGKVVDELDVHGLQFNIQATSTYGLQFQAAFYNVTNLRILCDFPSRGTNQITTFEDQSWSESSDTITVNTGTNHNLTVGDRIEVTSTQSGLSAGKYTVSAIPNNIQFQFVAVGSSGFGTLDYVELNLHDEQIGSGNSWSANSTATGDFGTDNLNTDIVEQVWRSDTGGVNNINLDCDTEIAQGISMDTFALLNHNFTKGATVQLFGSNSPTFVTTPFSETLEITDTNIYYIAPELPLETYRYWRVSITDSANPDDYLEIGTIVFGSSFVLQEECFVDQLDFQLQDFADKVDTEGFTNVSNSRTQKRNLKLDFRSLDIIKSNFPGFRNIFITSRTVNKCLWIPTPDVEDQSITDRFAVFAKLTQVPVETHNSKGPRNNYVSFTVDLDESN